MKVFGTAAAKIILFGEHAVVYGHPAIAVPVSTIRAAASVDLSHPSHSTRLQVFAQDVDRWVSLDESQEDGLSASIRRAISLLGFEPSGMAAAIHSDIPLASGLGSGAALTAALVRAVTLANSQYMSNETLNAIVYETERIHHGTPSGIDNTVIVYEKPIYFRRGHDLEPIRSAAPLMLLIGDTGISAPTKESVADVRRLYEDHPLEIESVLNQIGQIAEMSRALIESGDLLQLGRNMTDNHHLLQELTVSSHSLDRLVNAALAAGALGAKLSGGGRGGNMIALVEPTTKRAVSDSLLDAGAVRVIQTTVT
ncbi:MAG: mevalonate kinase [Anaerolineae bacterium]|nr:mevalonate kinase [Anaerolineae bacterium]